MPTLEYDVLCVEPGCTEPASGERPVGVSGPAKVGDHAEDGWIYTELVCKDHA